jgi:tyrosyl-tRNA synthetase
MLVATGLCDSTSTGRRLVLQNGVRIDGELVESVEHMALPGERVLQAGKRKLVRLVPPA